MDSSIGNLIKNGFENIEQARTAAKNHTGMDAIVKEQDGTYSLYKMGNTIETTEDNYHRIVIDGALNSGQGKALQIVEIHDFDGFVTYAEDYRNASTENGIGIGSKIHDTYIPDAAKNEFFDAHNAEQHAVKHKGIEAVVKNADGTRSLYKLSQEELDKVMDNPSAYKMIEKIVVPGNFFNTTIDSINITINPHDEKFRNNGRENLKKQLEESRLYNNIGAAAGTFVTDLSTKGVDKDEKVIKAAETLIAGISTVDGLEELAGLLQKVSSMDTELYNFEIDELRTVYNAVMAMVSSGEITLTAEQKKSLESFAPALEKLETAKTKLNEKLNQFSGSISEANIHANKLKDYIAELKVKSSGDKGELALIKTLEKFMGDYIEALSSKNPENITLYSLFIQKVLEDVKAGKTNAPELKLQMARYNTMAGTVNEFRGTGELAAGQKESFMRALSYFTGKDSEITKSFEKFFDNPIKPDEEVMALTALRESRVIDQSEPSVKQPEPPQKNSTQQNKHRPVMAKQFSEADFKMTEEIQNNSAVKVLSLDKKLSENMEGLLTLSDNFKTSGMKVIKSGISFRNEIRAFIDVIEKEIKPVFKPVVDLIKDNLDKFIDIIAAGKNNLLSGGNITEKVINKVIEDTRNLINRPKNQQSSEKMEDTIARLRKELAKINEVPVEVIYEKIAEKLADQSFMNYLRQYADNEKKLLDKVTNEAGNFENNLNFDLKSKKFEDYLLKIALVSLKGI